MGFCTSDSLTNPVFLETASSLDRSNSVSLRKNLTSVLEQDAIRLAPANRASMPDKVLETDLVVNVTCLYLSVRAQAMVPAERRVLPTTHSTHDAYRLTRDSDVRVTGRDLGRPT